MSEESAQWQVLKWAWDNWDKVQQRLTNLYRWFRGSKRKPGILILGAGGTGKTTLAKMLAGQYDFHLDRFRDYAESVEIERYTLGDDENVEIVVPPGQKHRREATWGDLQTDIAAGAFRGIIIVSCYGFHSLGDLSYKRHELYHGKKSSFLTNYLRDRRAEELAIMERLSAFVEACRSKIWLLTVVTKQDLWWGNRATVEKHHRLAPTQAFGRQIARLTRTKSAARFRHEHVACSLAINNFVTGKNELLKVPDKGYDQQRQLTSIKRLFAVVDGLMHWEIDS